MYLLRADDGRFVSSVAGDGLRLVDRCGDDAVWVRAEEHEDVFHSRTSSTRLTVRECSAELGQAVQVLVAPQKLPSEYLRELRQQGYVLIDNVLTAEESATVRQIVFHEMEAQAKSEGARGAGAWDFVRTCPQVLRFHTHPVMLWVVGNYLGTQLVRAAHPPVPRVAAPGSGHGGWVRVCPICVATQRSFLVSRALLCGRSTMTRHINSSCSVASLSSVSAQTTCPHWACNATCASTSTPRQMVGRCLYQTRTS